MIWLQWKLKDLLSIRLQKMIIISSLRDTNNHFRLKTDLMKERYAKLSGHGMKLLAEALEADLPYKITCPALLICGERDRAGSCIRYNKAWHKDTGIRIEWIKDAGHNSNTDQPEVVNKLIEKFLQKCF